MTDGKRYVSASIKRIRKRLKESPDKAQAFKDSLKDTVAFGLEDFENRLRSGQIKIDNVSDFERLAKLGLLLYGEATEKVEHTTDIEEVTTAEIDSIKETEEFKALKEKLARELNKQNENA